MVNGIGWVASLEDVPAGIVLNRLYQDGQPAGVDYLAAVLKEYGYDLGEPAGSKPEKEMSHEF